MENKAQFNETTVNRKGTLTYPYLLLGKVVDEVAVLIGNLKPGTLPVVIYQNGRIIKVKDIEKDLISFSKFLKGGCEISIVLSADKVIPIKQLDDILGIEDFVWTD